MPGRLIGYRLPIRWRLTAWYAGLLGVALLVFGAVLYLGLRTQLYEGLDDQVQNQYDLVAGAVRVAGGRPSLDIDQVPGTDADQFVRLWTTTGDPVIDTGQALDVPAPGADLLAAVNEGNTRWVTQRAGPEPLRIMSAPVVQGDTVVGMLQVGISRGDVEETLSILLALLGGAAPLLIGLAVWGGYLVAGRALSPVATITRMAGSISGSGLHARLNLDLPDDELGRLAQTFDAMLVRIDDAFERQRRFTGDAAHELRTPMALMRSRVDLALARQRSAEDYHEALRGVDRDLLRLNGLVGTLLALARADASELTIDRGRFDPAWTILIVLEQYREVAEAAGVELLADVAPSPLEADEDLVIQVLVNLIDNALAHTTVGDTVTVGCRPAGAAVSIWVEDTGSGIAPEHQERVFDRFYRVDAGRTRGYGGTGLGLSICRMIVGAHGGSITLTSSPGNGTRVDVRLPAFS